MGSVSKRKVKAFIRFFAQQKGIVAVAPIRMASDITPIEEKVWHMKERVWQSQLTSTPFDKNLEGVRDSLESLEGTVHASQQSYLQSMMSLHKKVEEVKEQQEQEHKLRIKQNKLLATKGQIILLEKKIGELTKIHPPADLEPLKEKLRNLKKQYKNIIHSNPNLSDVTQDILTSPNLEQEEIAAPLVVEAPPTPQHIILDEVHQAVEKASAERMDLIDIPTFDDSFTMPTIISNTPISQQTQSLELPPPQKKGFLSKIFHRKSAS